MAIKKELIKSSLSAYIVLSIKMFSGFLFQTIILRYLKPEDAGFYFTFLSIAYLLNMILNLGVMSALQYFLPKGKDKRTYLSTAFVYSFFTSLIIGGLIYLINIKKSYALLVSISALNMLLGGFLLITLHLIKSFKFRTIVSFVQGIVKLGITFLSLIIGSFNIVYVFVALLLSSLLTIILSISKLISKKLLSLSFSKNHLINLIKIGFPLYIVMMSESVLGWLDTYFLSVLKSNIAIAEYNAILIIIKRTFIIIIPVLALSVLPIITPLKKGERKKVDIWLFKIGIFFTLFMVFYLIYTSYNIISILYPKYINTVNLFLLGLVCFLPLPIAKFMIRMSIADGKTDHLIMPALVLILFNVILNYLLIPNFGSVGALLSSGLSILIFTVLMLKGHKYFLPPLNWIVKYVLIISISFIISIFIFNEMPKGLIKNIITLLIKTGILLTTFLLIWLVSSPKEDKEIARKIIDISLTFLKNAFNN